MKKRKANFWDMFPKITLTFMVIMSAYIMHREYDVSDTISGLSFILPLMMLVYFIITQVLDTGERKGSE